MSRLNIFVLFAALAASFFVSGGARAGYDPTLGRWLSRDPMNNAELRQGANLYSYVHNDPIDRTDPLGLWYALNPATWAIGEYEGIAGGGNYYRAIDFSEGLYAGLDGLIPFRDPFAANGFYDPCDRTLQRSQAIGELGLKVESALLTRGAFNAYGEYLALENGLNWSALGFGERLALSRGSIPVFLWNSGLGGQAVGLTLTGTGGYLLYGSVRTVIKDGQVIFGP